MDRATADHSSDDISAIIQSFMETQIDGGTKHVLSVLVTQILKPRVVSKGVSVCVVFPPRPKPSKSHHKISPKRVLVSPRTPRSESDAFLPFSMSASFRAEAWKDRQQIDTPHWQIIHSQDSCNQGQDSSDEDISDETYFKMHASCFDALRKENQQILNNLTRKKKGSDVLREGETQSSGKKQSVCYPPTFNYDTSWSASKPWKKPKKFIEMVLSTPARTLSSSSHDGQQFATSKRSLKNEEGSPPSNSQLQDLVANHQVALLQLRYLHLRKQLALLRQRSLTNSSGGPDVLTFSVNSADSILTADSGKHCLNSIRKTSRPNAGVRKKKLDEL